MNLFRPLQPNRQSHRFRNHDYRQPGAYFITLCTSNRLCQFGDVVDGHMQHTYLGHIAHAHWNTLPQHFSNLELDVWQVMPNHLHGILILEREPESGGTESLERTSLKNIELKSGTLSGSVGAVIQNYKKVTTRKVRQITGDDEYRLWQRDYYDHVIRSDEDMNRIREYIIQNPSAWQNDPDNGSHP